MENLSMFQFQGSRVRIKVVEGDPWFSLSDIVKNLSIGNTTDVKARISREKIDTFDSIDVVGREKKMVFVSEAGLYEAILGSRTNEKTESFKRWVTDEVLPSIRKHGEYQNTLYQKAIRTLQGLDDIEAIQDNTYRLRLQIFDAISEDEIAMLNTNLLLFLLDQVRDPTTEEAQRLRVRLLKSITSAKVDKFAIGEKIKLLTRLI